MLCTRLLAGLMGSVIERGGRKRGSLRFWWRLSLVLMRIGGKAMVFVRGSGELVRESEIDLAVLVMEFGKELERKRGIFERSPSI